MDTNLNGDGSNAIILPQKKKNKGKGAGKASRKSKAKEPQKMSKTKERKLKQIQEEKEKRLLLSRSIEVLEKHKIWGGAYSLMKCSGTIGQTETMREKRRRAVEFSKAGLQVPEEISLFKRKRKEKAIKVAAVKLDSNQSHLEHNHNDSQLLPVECADEDVGSQPSLQVTNNNTHTCMMEGAESHSTPCDSDERLDTNSQCLQPGVSDIVHQNNVLPTDVMFMDCRTTPIIVHVSRPKEVEETRRDLPIVMMEQEIMEAINEHPVVIICGETGCGKTTQVPQFLYEAGFGSKDHSDRKGMIGVTQPRRVAVLATAKRVAFELGLHLGKEVGFQVRHDKMIGSSCSVKFMTDGILLREVQNDFLLRQYSVLILDEAHERSLNTDILIGMLSRVVRLRQKIYMEQQEKLMSGVKISPENIITQLRLVLMSATLRVEDFILDRKLFSDTPPVVEVAVRQYPVTIHFSKNTKVDYLGQAFKKVMSIHKMLPPGGILVFVTGQREVEFLCKKLRKASERLTKKSSKLETESNLTSDVDMKEINEAYEVEGNSPYQQTDMFSDDENPHDAEVDCYSSDSELESGSEAENEDEDVVGIEGSQQSGLAVDFLKDAASLSSLKAAFETLAGNVSEPDCKQNTDLLVAPATEGHLESAARSAGALYVLPLYAMLPANAQLRVFADIPERERLVVVATNVAETSLTIPGIKYVVDTGKEKVKNYKYTSGMATYEVQWISKASAAQRAGRAGRTGPGHCYRLYSSAAFGKDDIFPKFSCPEISKVSLDGVVLLLKSMGIDKIVNFPFPTPPKMEALVEAEKCLKALNALDPQGRLTRIGEAMGQYPMSPRHSRMLLTFIEIMRSQPGYLRADLVLAYAVAVAAALSVSNPIIVEYEAVSSTSDDVDHEEKKDEKPGTEKMKEKMEKQVRKKAKAAARESRARFCNPSSDALTIAHALQLFELSDDPITFCKTNALHLKTMEEMSKLRKQLLQLVFFQSKVCEEFSWNHGKINDVECSWRKYPEKQPLLLNEEKLLGQAICAGWADRVAKRIRVVSKSEDQKVNAARYQSCALKDTVFLHRWSSASQSAPEFLVYTELLCSKRPYMHGVTAVNADWLIKHASPLCTFSAPLTDPKPYYNPLNDQVLCWVSPTFGPHNWELPLQSLPIKNTTLRVSVFASALLEGNVLPCLKTAQKFLAAPPSSILRPEALGQRRVGDLLNRLKIGSRPIDSRAMLREIWSEKPQFLYTEIQQWFQDKFHVCFAEIWEQMHEEAKLECNELFAKRAKKDRKKIKKH
ncbi:hypothetical protein J5N97_023302 [Dioscorea zingiberensis]|uniref:RNA helicase n=1 Tax=Dioscorea zingiberensis TaxID=325984 RepID=A0A9D5HBQ5_9LILI|nr:hypothetical protein J5N97_023302 [Dioscorea zingiberensis]